MVDAVIQIVFENLNSLIQREYGVIQSVQEEMKKLSSTLSTIRDVLDDAELKEVEDKAVKSWLLKLKDAAYDADDILDEFATETMCLKLENEHETMGLRWETARAWCLKHVRGTFLSCLNVKEIMFQNRMGHKIIEIVRRFDEIAAEKSKFLSKDIVVYKGSNSLERMTSSLLTDVQVFGREREIKDLSGHLLNSSGNIDSVSFCPIVGMGGIGKTTLAQVVYNDEEVIKNFEVRVWVWVSEYFDVRRLTKSIIESVTGDACDLVNLDTMQRRLQQLLRGKKFLLVLDDVWDEDSEKWDRFRCSLTCGANGSSVIITTRSEKVASVMSTVASYNLKGLSEDDCCALFMKRALSSRREVKPTFVTIGKEIAKKCGGIPLAAKALGSLMYFKTEEVEWMNVRDTEIWNLREEEENVILPALKLSYNHLPSYMKRCFAICSIFPKGYNLKKEELIHLWMADGIIRPSGTLGMEDVGNEIFINLFWRSLLQDVQEAKDGSIKCRMHGLVHDLASAVSVNESCIVDARKEMDVHKCTSFPSKIRHSSLILDSETVLSALPGPLKKCQTIRTFLVLNPEIEAKDGDCDWSDQDCIPRFPLNQMLLSSNRLRALNLSKTDIKKLPQSVTKLKCLRLLNLSRTKIKFLPEGITKLRNLQTLILSECSNLSKLPSKLSTMTSLIHVDINRCFDLRRMPIGLGKLYRLETLTFFIVGREVGRHIDELKLLNIKGKLCIKGLEHVRNAHDATEAQLWEKKNLHTLTLVWDDHDYDYEWSRNAKNVLEALRVPENVRKLHVENYIGFSFPNWLEHDLTNLVELTFRDCTNCTTLPQLGQHSNLQILAFTRMNSVRCIRDDFFRNGELADGFKSLTSLSFHHMENFERWGEDNRRTIYLPCLVKLVLMFCPLLKRLPVLGCPLQELKLTDCSLELLSSLGKFTTLQRLKISMVDMTSFPRQVLDKLGHLEHLSISWCDNLESFPKEFGNLTTLLSLKLKHCVSLASLPEDLRNLTSLKSLTMDRCDSLTQLPEVGFQGLKSLSRLSISKCPNLMSFSGALQHLSALEYLHIKSCEELVLSPSDNLQNLISLQQLEICSMPNLNVLPEEIKNLSSMQSLIIRDCPNMALIPDGFQQLTNLQYIYMERCPHLESRCMIDTGEDWHKIAHVTSVQVVR